MRGVQKQKEYGPTYSKKFSTFEKKDSIILANILMQLDGTRRYITATIKV
jgi:hypothetical protein